jgi:hypothetical protein
MKAICFVFIPVVVSFFLWTGCSSQKPCDGFPRAFKTVDEAELRLNMADCESLYDSVSFQAPAYIRKAAYYSCNKTNGFLLLQTSEKKWVIRDLPMQLWKNLAKAKSFDSYFKQNIQHRYPVYLEKRL